MSKLFYTVTVEYNSQDFDIRLFRVVNLTAEKLKQFRENVFIAGAYRRIDADTGEVISPYRIRSMMIYKQAHFFNAAEEDKPLTQSQKPDK